MPPREPENGLGRGWVKYAGNLTAVGAIIAIVLFQTWRAEVRFDVLMSYHKSDMDTFQAEVKAQREHDADRTRRISEKLSAIEQANRDNGKLLAEIRDAVKDLKKAETVSRGWWNFKEQP
jgi:uncharacterized phage infection (PIP) family protein YhgE